MTESRSTILGVGFLLVAIGAVVCLVYKAVMYLIGAFTTLKPEIGAAIVITCGTVLVSVLSVLLAKYFEQREQIRREQWDKKVEVYQKLVTFWCLVLFAEKLGKEPPTIKDTVEFFAEFLKDIIPWGSDDVLKSLAAFRASTSGEEGDPGPRVLVAFETMLFEMRKDLGHRNREMKTGDLLRLFINDLDEEALNTQTTG